MLPAFISCKEIMQICGCSQSKGYEILRTLNKELTDKGYITAGHGRVSSDYFCKRMKLDQTKIVLTQEGAKTA